MRYTEEQLAAFEKAIDMFRGDVNAMIFTTFFSQLKLFSVSEEGIVIEAPNAMVVEQLRARHFHTLRITSHRFQDLPRPFAYDA